MWGQRIPRKSSFHPFLYLDIHVVVHNSSLAIISTSIFGTLADNVPSTPTRRTSSPTPLAAAGIADPTYLYTANAMIPRTRVKADTLAGLGVFVG